MNNFKLTVGIEVHTELNTKTKMFSASPNVANAEVNTVINEIDLGLPGILPSPNKAAVAKAIKLATALKMKIATELSFDRKNYFYQDLPKGYQITQQYNPVGQDGQVVLPNKTIRIEKIQLEEDTAKQQTIDGKLCLDYNRCGVPLIEIVTKPDIETPEEAVAYLNQLKRILIFLDISDGKMENGSLRADVNVSVAPYGSKELGTKVEIKNLNSFANVANTIKYEFDRQIRQLIRGDKVVQETRRWDETKNQTTFMRLKSNAIDYRFFREPNIVQINIEQLIKETHQQINDLPELIKKKLLSNNVPLAIVEQLLDNHDAYKAYKYVDSKINNPSVTITWILVELAALLKKDGQSFNDVDLTIYDLIVELINLLIAQKINGKQAKIILEHVYKEHKHPEDLVKELGFKQITDEKIIAEMLNKYIQDNEAMVKQYDERPERVEKFIIGLLMRDTKGQANPEISTKLLKSLLK